MSQIALPTIFPKKNLSGKICISPFVVAQIDLQGQVRLCGCSGWLPTTIGNIFETALSELLKSSLSKKIRQSIIDGTYIFCNESTCGILRNNQLNTIENIPDAVAWQIQDASRYLMPGEIYISGDLTCNLSCPSCRTKVIKLSTQQKNQQVKYVEQLTYNIFSTPTDQKINLTLSTSGELFASDFLLSFVNKIPVVDFPNLELSILTNGLLCEKNWHKLGAMQNRVRQITVTIDAAQSKTYEKLRRGGTWKKIMSSMSWLQQKKKQNNMKLYTRIVVQYDNYKEIEEFYNMSRSFEADRVEYARISNWKTMSDADFLAVDVLNPTHKSYHDALTYWNRIKDFTDVMSWG